MSSNKLTHVHVYIIGLVLMLIVGAGMWFGMLDPIHKANAALALQIQGVESTQVDVNGKSLVWNQLDDAQTALAAAKTTRQQMQAQLDRELATRSLPASQAIDLGDLSEQYVLNRTLPNWLLLPRRVVTTMGDYVVRSARRYGVTVTASFAAPAPSLDPATVARQDIIAWDLGSMTVTGDFNRVMAWAKGFNNAPILCSVDGLKPSLAGRNGSVTSSCVLTVFVFPKMNAGAAPPAAAGGAMPGGAVPGGDMPGGMTNGPGG